MHFNNNSLLKIYKLYLANKLPLICSSILCMIIVAICTTTIVHFIKPIFDQVFYNPTSISSIVWTSFTFTSIFVLKGLSSYGESFLQGKCVILVTRDIKQDIFKNLIRQDLAFFYSNHSGTIISKMDSDLILLTKFLEEVSINLGRNLFTVVFLFIYMIYEAPYLTLVCGAILPIAIVVISKISNKLKVLAKASQTKVGICTSFLSQSLQGILLIKASTTEEFETERSKEILSEIYKLGFKSIQTSNLMHPIMELICALITLISLIIGGVCIFNGIYHPSILFQFLTAFLFFFKPAKELAKLSTSIRAGSVYADRIFSLLDVKPSIVDPTKNRVEISKLRHSIEFSSISFKYNDADRDIFANINFSIPAKRITVVCGPSGVGKTTIVNLLLRFYDPTDGVIKIDGIDIKNITLKNLRSMISLVSQQLIIFNDTIRNNVCYGISDVTEDRFRKAVSEANLDEYVTSLPDGYETIVTENGTNMSGGQKQRVAIARAILRNSDIIIFDEPTSALDKTNVDYISRTIAKLSGNKTIIVITHDHSFVKKADKIIEISYDEVITKISNDVSRNSDE